MKCIYEYEVNCIHSNKDELSVVFILRLDHLVENIFVDL